MRQLFLLPLALLAVACGAEEAAVVDAQQVAAKTGDAASARIEMSMSIDTFDQPLTPKAKEEIAVLTFSAKGQIADHGRLYRLAYRFAPETFGLEQGEAATFDAVIDSDKGDMYIQYAPSIGVELPPGKKWVHVRDDELGGYSQASDPSQMVAYLTAAGELLRYGEERVRGVKTVRYAATIDVAKARDRGEEALGRSLEQSLATLEASGVREIPMEVWIDGDGYLRRLHLDWRLPNAKDLPEGGRLKIRLELWDFGTPVDVRLPPEASVVEQQDLEE